MTGYRKAGIWKGRALRLLLPLLLVIAGLTPHSVVLGPELAYLAPVVPTSGHTAPFHVDRPADNALFLRPGAATLKKPDAERRQDGRTDRGDGLVTIAPAAFLALSHCGPPLPVSSTAPIVTPRHFHSRAPPFLTAA